MAGYSGTPLVKKLGLKPGQVIGVLNPPDELEALLGPLPEGARIVAGVRSHRDVVLAFFRLHTELEQKRDAMIKAIEPDGAIWVAWPKKASRQLTDITEDIVREVALPAGLVDVKVCAIDDVWSGLRLVVRKALRVSSRGGAPGR